VVIRSAPALIGPWSEPAKLFTADHKSKDGWTYDALPHPEFAEENGRVQYVTFSRPTGEFLASEVAVVRVELR
jgi:hypothetical protein